MVHYSTWLQMEYFGVLMVWGGVFTFLLHSQWPDRAQVWGCGGSARWRIRSLSSCRSPRHLLHTISLKGDTGANQSCCCLHRTSQRSVVCWRSGPPLTQTLIILLLSCLACFWLPSLLTHATTLANCRRQIHLDSSLTRSLIQDLRLPSHPWITHIPSALFELSHIITSFGTWRGRST